MFETMQPGRYFLGDPCYCFCNDTEGRENWPKILDDLDFFNQTSPEWPGLVGSNTAYGDGRYYDNHGNRYYVDAGLIGLTHERYWEVEETELNRLGLIVQFNEEFIFDANSGRFYIGDNYVIDTAGNGDY